MVPDHMLEASSDQYRLQFFERVLEPSGSVGWTIRQQPGSSSGNETTDDENEDNRDVVIPSENPAKSLMEIVSVDTNRKRKYPPSETGNTPRNYQLFVDLIQRMLTYDPQKRIKPDEALNHPFVAGSS